MHRFGMWPLLVAQQQDGDVIIFRPLDLLHQNIKNLRYKDKARGSWIVTRCHKFQACPNLIGFSSSNHVQSD